MIHHKCPYVTFFRTWLHRSRPHLSQEQKKIPLPRMLILPDRSSVTAHLPAPFPTAHCRVTVLCPVPVTSAPRALAPRSLRHSPTSQSPTLLTYVLVTCAACSLIVYLSSIVVGAPQTPPWPLGCTCHGASGLPQPRQGHPRALPVLVVLVCRGSPPDPTPTIGPGLPLHYVANVCFKCFRCFRGILQLLHMDLAKVDGDVAHVAFVCKCFQWYVASILKKNLELCYS
jgi:hypothetical protein